jgi:hypothetical protein
MQQRKRKSKERERASVAKAHNITQSKHRQKKKYRKTASNSQRIRSQKGEHERCTNTGNQSTTYRESESSFLSPSLTL